MNQRGFRHRWTLGLAALIATALTATACGAGSQASPSAAVSGSGSPSLASPTTSDLVAVADKAQPAVVKIVVATCDQSGTGSGFFIDATHVLTAGHVVADSKSIALTSGNSRYVGNVVGYNSRADVAMIEIRQGRFAGTPLTLANDDPRVGDAIVAIGFPLGEALTSTRGHVTGTGERVRIEDGVRRGRLIKTDSLVSPGNSGGPLVGLDGRAYGVVHAGDTYDTEFGWAVSPVVAADFARAWLNQPQSYESPNCSGGGGGWVDSGPSEPPDQQGGVKPDSWPSYQYAGPAAYNVCLQASYPITEGLRAPSSPPSGSSKYWTITSVQAALRALNYGSPRGVVVDGKYGPRSAAAVRSFQSRKGLTVDGLVGPQTWGELHRTVGLWSGLCG